MKTNYHTHTYRCKHANGTDEEYVKAAIESGFETLGFTDHTPWKYDSNYVSSIRMETTEIDEYIFSLKELRAKYKEQIDIKIGLECEYFPDYLPWLKDLLMQKEIDYIILGNHYHKSDIFGGYYGSKTKDASILKRYVDDCIDGLKTGLYSYLAHPDLIDYAHIENEAYRKEMGRLCKYARKNDVLLEYNLTGIITNRNYPNDIFWRIVAREGCKAVIGFDAHKPEHLKRSDLYEKAKRYLDTLGIKRVDQIPLDKF